LLRGAATAGKQSNNPSQPKNWICSTP
jgi:hypothetical protein